MRTKAGVTIDAKGEVNVMLYGLPCSGSFGDGAGGQSNGFTGLLTLSKEERMKLAQELLDSAGAVGYFVITRGELHFDRPPLPGPPSNFMGRKPVEEESRPAARDGSAEAQASPPSPFMIACSRPLTETDRKNISALLDGTLFQRHGEEIGFWKARAESQEMEIKAVHGRLAEEQARYLRLEGVLRGMSVIISAEVSR